MFTNAGRALRTFPVYPTEHTFAYDDAVYRPVSHVKDFKSNCWASRRRSHVTRRRVIDPSRVHVADATHGWCGRSCVLWHVMMPGM